SEFAGQPKRTLAALDPYGRPCEPTSRDTGSNGMFLVLELYREPRKLKDSPNSLQLDFFLQLDFSAYTKI
ncbi:MAG: hypothetical protein P8X55_08600, partial [Desulfosarcinaceae bacterium]